MRTSDVEEDKRNGVSATQKRGHEPLSEEVRVKKKTSIPITSDRTDDKGGPDKNTKTSNKNLGTLQWITKQPVVIGEDFHSQVGDDKVRSTLYKVRWE